MNTIPGMLVVGYGLAVVLYGGYWVNLMARRRALAAQLAARSDSD